MDTASSAARKLFEEHGAAVYRFAILMLRHPQDAEDVVQETFLKLLNHLSIGGNTENLRGWIFTVAAHGARDRQRTRRRWVPWAPVHESTVGPEDFPDEDGRLRAARVALHRLSARDRLLIALRGSGLSYRDIATSTGVRATSVGRLLARALDRWAKAYGETARENPNGQPAKVERVVRFAGSEITDAANPEKDSL